MYNLLCFSVDWSSGMVEIPLSRVLEYTDSRVREKFYSNGELNLEAIKELPCIFCDEGEDDEDAYIGHLRKVEKVGKQLSLEVTFDTSIQSLTNKLIYECRQLLSITEFEFSRNHWAVKNIDLYRALLQYSNSRRPSPTVFKISPFEKIDEDLVSLMMPFDAGFEVVRNAISQAVMDIGFECMRADDIWEHHSIIQDIVSLIDRSRIVICDCTGKNPNVFYEAGIAHTLGREVIIIAQNEGDVPFDLRHLRYIKYLKNEQGLGDLSNQIKNRVQKIINR